MILDFTWERQMELIAKDEFANGKAEGKAEMVVSLLKLRFGELPEELREEILSEKAEVLNSILEPAANAKSLEEFQERYHQVKYLT